MVLPLSRLHDVRGERSNVPRRGAGVYGAGKGISWDILIENLGKLVVKDNKR